MKKRNIVGIGLLAALCGTRFCAADPVVATAASVDAGGRRMAMRVVKVRLSDVRIRVGLAHGLVGRTESLAKIAQRNSAIAAINGGYFAAYTANSIKNPTHTIGSGGQVIHKGNIGSVLFFAPDHNGQLQGHIARVPLKITGTLEGGRGWFAYWINRHPEQSARTITIFNRFWGGSTGLNDGTQIVVSSGVVTKIGNGSQQIPANGFVIYCRGAQDIASRFRVGQKCAYRIEQDGAADANWPQMREAVGCGPTLVQNGKIVANPEAEGFSDPKAVSQSTQRSAVGLTRDGVLILATGSGTIRQLAAAMKSLGAWQAMNLDGGASSGLWFGKRYLTSPGRNINAALLVLNK